MIAEIETIEKSLPELTNPNITREHCAQELTKLKRIITKEVFQLREEYLIEQYIHHTQKLLIEHADLIFLQTDFKQVNDDHTALNAIEQMLAYLEHYYKKYYCLKQLLPLWLKQKHHQLFKEKLKTLKLTEENTLFQLVMHPLRTFVYYKNEISYHQLYYYQKLLKVVGECIKNKIDDQELKTRMILINYNCFSFFQYMINEISCKTGATDSLQEKINILIWYQKWVKQQPYSTDAYCTNEKPIKELLADWIKEEIYFVEQNCEWAKMYHQQLTHTIIHWDLSVAELAFLLRIFTDIKLITNENVRAVANFFAQTSRTKAGAPISASSLHKKIYSIEPKTTETINTKVIQMLNRIRDYR